MTKAGWTSEKPTAAGFWWWRQSDRVKYLYIVEVDSEMNVWFHGKEDESRVDYLTGEWLGPITPTDRQQGKVEGLREAVEIVKANSDVKKAVEIIRLHALAQQAQGGVEE